LRSRQIGIDLDLDFSDNGEAAVDFGDDEGLLCEGWQGYRQCAA
jgi:hypothetical protein